MTISSAGRTAAVPGASRSSWGPAGVFPEWAQWNQTRTAPYTVGVEEEVFLLEAVDRSLAQSSDWVLGRLPDELRAHVAPETHAAVIELATGVHADLGPAVVELAGLRAGLARELGAISLSAACSGMYPLESRTETRISGAERYRRLANSMRSLARRDPTLALHVHIGMPDPEDAIRLYNGLRPVVPILLALAANSPFSAGRDTGFASARTVTFQGFPRTGIARRFANYEDYVRAVDGLISSGALPDPTFLWWDVRLQPALGTVEVRMMDAQSSIGDTAALVTLIMSLASLILDAEEPEAEIAPEVLTENRFLAARDGLEARLIDPGRDQLVPIRQQLERLIERCHDQGDRLSSIELARVPGLACANGAERQRAWARTGGLEHVMSMLGQQFADARRAAAPLPTDGNERAREDPMPGSRATHD